MYTSFYLIFLALGVYANHETVSSLPNFPPDFLFGAATSSYQIEGAWNADGKGENIWDRYTHTHNERMTFNHNGDVACNSYYLYEEDINILAQTRFQIYRFSISWARILPNGDLSQVNQAGIAYYNNLINVLLENNIQPMITMYHWDLPQNLEDKGGWLNSSIVGYMEDYANLLFSLYGDRVKWWITINEPFLIIRGYYESIFAPGLNLNTPYDYIVAHNLLKAHGRIYRLYEKKYQSQQNGKISIALEYHFGSPKNVSSIEDTRAVERYFQFRVGLFAHPIYSEEGGYPPLVEQIVNENSQQEGLLESRLPIFTKEEKMELRGSADFFALNHYTTKLCSHPVNKDQTTSAITRAPFHQDMDVDIDIDPSWPSSNTAWLKVVPWGFKGALMKITSEYNQPPIFVTENGYSDKGDLVDIDRIKYHTEYLVEMLNAMHNHNCTVIGYCVWSLMDDFEWKTGYSEKFGIVRVEFESDSTERKRTPKASAIFFALLNRLRQITSKIGTIDFRNILKSVKAIFHR